MTTSTPTLTLTQSGLLAVLLQRQRYAVIELARRHAHRQDLRAAFGRPSLGRFVRSRHERSSTTPGAGNRFTATCGSNIPNGSSQMANPPCASWKSSTLSREEDPTSRSLLLSAPSNRELEGKDLRNVF